MFRATVQSAPAHPSAEALDREGTDRPRPVPPGGQEHARRREDVLAGVLARMEPLRCLAGAHDALTDEDEMLRAAIADALAMGVRTLCEDLRTELESAKPSRRGAPCR